MSGHFEQGFFITNSNDVSSYIAPPPKRDEYRVMEQCLLCTFHVHDSFNNNDVAQAIWSSKAIIGTEGSVLNNNATYGISILIYQEDNEQPVITASI
jgi:hypothetical protein